MASTYLTGEIICETGTSSLFCRSIGLVCGYSRTLASACANFEERFFMNIFEKNLGMSVEIGNFAPKKKDQHL
jgi:hypothetical protein